MKSEGEDVVQIYHRPVKGDKYCIGVDAATGVGRDYTSIQVWCRRIPFEQVGWHHSKFIKTPKGSEIMIDLAKWYNNALLVIETNYPGNAYQDNAIEVYNYNNCYHKEKHLDESNKESSKFGFHTTEAEKNLIRSETETLLLDPRGPQLIFHDPVTLNEFCSFVYIEDKRKMGAIEGATDDTVMAAMLALHGCTMFPQAARPKRKKFNLTEDEAQQEYLLKKHVERLCSTGKILRM